MPRHFSLSASFLSSPLTSTLSLLLNSVAREDAINSAVAASALNAGGSTSRGRASSKMRQIHHPLFANTSYKEAEDRCESSHTTLHCTALYYSVCCVSYVSVPSLSPDWQLNCREHVHSSSLSLSPLFSYVYHHRLFWLSHLISSHLSSFTVFIFLTPFNFPCLTRDVT